MIVLILLFLLIGFVLIYLVPGGFWFPKLWMAGVVSYFMYLVLYKFYKPNSLKILTFESNFLETEEQNFKVQFYLFSFFTGASLMLFLPNWVLEENELVMLKNLNISAVTLYVDDSRVSEISGDRLKNFTKRIQSSKIFYPSHNTPIDSFKIMISGEDQAYTYDAKVLEDNPKDLIISFKKWFYISNILVPNVFSNNKS